MSRTLPLVADEVHHVAEINVLLDGTWRVIPTLTTIPGYHALLAGLARLFNHAELPWLRLFSFGLCPALLATIYVLARQLGDGRAIERTVQIALLPILFPFFFLVYTDVAALLLFCLALLFQMRKHYAWAGLTATLCLLVRQTYIVWLLLAALWMARDMGWSTRSMTHAASYLIGVIAFIAFVTLNGGIAIGDREMHPFPGVYLGNLYFALFVCFLLFAPLHLAGGDRPRAFLRSRGAILATALVLPLFLTTFVLDHPYNQPELNWWLHNRVLHLLAASLTTKMIMFASMVVAGTTLWRTQLHLVPRWWVGAGAVLSLLPVWQIEPRYYLMPVVAFLLFRRHESLLFEWGVIAYFAALSGILFVGIANASLFL